MSAAVTERTTTSTAVRERATAALRVPAGDGRASPSGSLSDGGIPARSLEQRRVALEKANRIRCKRAALKRGLTDGTVSPAALFRDPDCASMKVRDLLLALRRVGEARAEKIMREISVSHRKTVGGLSPRQERELMAVLDGNRPRKSTKLYDHVCDRCERPFESKTPYVLYCSPFCRRVGRAEKRALLGSVRSAA